MDKTFANLAFLHTIRCRNFLPRPHLLNSMGSAMKECGSVGTPRRMILPLVFSSGSRAEISCAAATVSMMPSNVFTAAFRKGTYYCQTQGKQQPSGKAQITVRRRESSFQRHGPELSAMSTWRSLRRLTCLRACTCMCTRCLNIASFVYHKN